MKWMDLIVSPQALALPPLELKRFEFRHVRDPHANTVILCSGRAWRLPGRSFGADLRIGHHAWNLVVVTKAILKSPMLSG